MASIHQTTRKRRPWVVKYRDHAGRQRSHSCATHKEAIAYRDIVEATRPTGTTKATLYAATQAYLDEVLATASPKTYAGYKSVLSHFCGWIGDKQLDALMPGDLSAYRNAIATERAAKTVDNALRVLRAFANWAIRSGHRPTSFMAGVKFPKVKARTPRWLDPEEADRLMAAVKEAPADIRLAITIAMRSGMRLGDIGQLKWQDIRLDTREIHVIEGKSANPRIVPMHQDIHDLLMDWPQQGEALFPPIRKTCRTIGANVNALGRRCRDWMAENGFAAGMHSLRHTAATQLAQAGATMTDLQEILGHTSQRVTAMYLHSTTGQKAALIARLGSSGQAGTAPDTAVQPGREKAGGGGGSRRSGVRKAPPSNKAARG